MHERLKELKEFWAGSGWYSIIESFCEIANAGGFNDDRSVVSKEKYGSLRLDVVGPEWLHCLAELCERVSDNTCEHCGKDGQVRTSLPRIRTLCSSCFIDNDKALSPNRKTCH